MERPDGVSLTEASTGVRVGYFLEINFVKAIVPIRARGEHYTFFPMEIITD